MARLIFLITCIFLILGQHEIRAKITYDIEEFIDDVGSVIPGAKFVLTAAVKLWLLYGEVRDLAQPNQTRIENELDLLNKKMDQISLKLSGLSNKIDVVAESIKDVKHIIQDKVVMELPQGINLNEKRDRFASLINTVKSKYNDYKQHDDESRQLNNETISIFADTIISPGAHELKATLDEICRLLVDRSGSYNIIDILSNEYLSNSLVCLAEEESPLHQINLLYKDAMIAEFRGLIMIQWAFATKQKLNKGESPSYVGELAKEQENSFVRMSKIVEKVKSAMLQAHPDYWTCYLPSLVEGKTFAKISPIFQKYIIKEREIEENITRFTDFLKPILHSCPDSCEDRKIGTDKCKGRHCKSHQRPCRGLVRDCQTFHPSLTICLADKNSERRYEYLESGKSAESEEIVYGHKKNCSGDNLRVVADDKRLLIPAENFVCEYCLCTCESTSDEDTEADRYISLKNTYSDVKDNKIVTGVKFTKKERGLYIEIQQGMLSANGSVNQSTVSWKSIDTNISSDYTSQLDYHTITWEERTVNLEDLKAETGNVLIGLRFKKVTNGIGLEIHVTPFDFLTGKLNTEKSRWISSPDNTPRTELDLENRRLPAPLRYRYLDSHDRQFLKFTTSSMKDDAGQTVVPYIDLQPVKTELAVPLAGAGLIHKSNDADSAGFLAFKLLTYNYAPHLEA